LDFFRLETSSQDAEVRTEAMKKLALVAALSGPEKTRSEILPYLQTKIEDLDQVLLAMADKLRHFLPLLGGPEHVACLVPLMEALADAEEVSVRDMAVEALNNILRQLSPTHKAATEAFYELFGRICSEESGELFYARVSSCHLVPQLYRLLGDTEKVAMRESYSRLCRDELPIVRRAASSEFLALAALGDAELVGGHFLALLQAIVGDESQTVQVIGVESVHAFAALLKKHGHTEALTNDLLPMVKAAHDSTSWRVRLALSKKIGSLAGVFAGSEVAEVCTCVMDLTQDPEPDVRSIAIPELLPFLAAVGASPFLVELGPVAAQLASDPIPGVRKLLADLVVDAAARVGPEAVALHLSDLVLRLVEDEDPMVRLRVVRKLPVIAEEAPSLCTRLTETLKQLCASPNWRVRKELLLAMPSLVKHMGQDYFVLHFLGPVLKLLEDRVDQVRTAAAAAVPLIAAHTDTAWAYETLFPPVRSMAAGTYLVRVSLVAALEGVLKLETASEKWHEEAMAMLVVTVADKVPNVRIRAAQAVAALNVAPSASALRAQLQPHISKLSSDKDRDVKYFCTHPTGMGGQTA